MHSALAGGGAAAQGGMPTALSAAGGILAGSMGDGLSLAAVGRALGCCALRELELWHNLKQHYICTDCSVERTHQRHFGTAKSGASASSHSNATHMGRGVHGAVHACGGAGCHVSRPSDEVVSHRSRFGGSGGTAHLTQRPTAPTITTPPSVACPTRRGVCHGIWVRDKGVW